MNQTAVSILVNIGCYIAGALTALALCKAFCKGSCKSGSDCAEKEDKKPAERKPARKFEGGERFERHHSGPSDGTIEIYVGNLSYDLTDDILRKEFEAFGKVTSARVITNRFNGKSKGFGFVHMPNRAEVDAAVAALNNKEILGRPLKCNEAKN